MAELTLEQFQTVEANSFEWPKVPQSKIESEEVLNTPLEASIERKPKPQRVSKEQDNPTRKVQVSDPVNDLRTRSSEVNLSTASPKSAEAAKAETLERRSTKLAILGLKKTQWPEPHLSLGTQCNRLGNNECWKAIGPAQDLLNLISKSIENLLEERVEDLEEGEQLAGHILLFDMYMVGKSATTAQPTLLFTCQRAKPRRRAIKYIRESGILKGYPKILFAESSLPPLVSGSSYLRLLAGRERWTTIAVREGFTFVRAEPWPLSSMPKRSATPTPVPNTNSGSGLSVGAKAGIGVGISIIFLICLGAMLFVIFRRRKVLDDTKSPGPEKHKEKHATIPDQNFRHPLPQLYQKNAAAGLFTSPVTSPELQNVEVHEVHGVSLDVLSSPRNLPSEQASGIPILCSGSRKRATMGEVVHFNGKYYGLTAAHPFAAFFASSAEDEIPSKYQEIDLEFSFVSEDEEEREEDISEVIITSQASMSSTDSPEFSRSNTAPSTSSNREAENTPSKAAVENSEVIRFKVEDQDISCGQASSVIGHLSVSSLTGTDLGLDWAMIELSDQSLYDTRYLNGLRGLWTGTGVLRQDLSRSDVWKNGRAVTVTTGYSGTIPGFLLPGSTAMRLTPRGKFQEVWTVQLDKSIGTGDSGAWVVDSETKDVCGHIVAGAPGGRLAYIIPASKVFKDIEKMLGGTC